MTPAPAISPLSPLGSPHPTFPDGLHPRGRGAPKPPRPVATGNGVSKGAAHPPGGPRKKGSAPALPLRFLPPHPPVETPVGRPAAQRAPRRGGVSEVGTRWSGGGLSPGPSAGGRSLLSLEVI